MADYIYLEDGTSKLLLETGDGYLLEQTLATTSIKSVDGLLTASVKSVDGVLIASVKSWGGLQ